MSAKTMADVLAEHQWKMGYRDMKWHCFCGWASPMADGSFIAHQGEALSAAGFGLQANAASNAPRVKRMRGELKSLGKHLDSWESQGHATVTIRFLRQWLRARSDEMGAA